MNLMKALITLSKKAQLQLHLGNILFINPVFKLVVVLKNDRFDSQFSNMLRLKFTAIGIIKGNYLLRVQWLLLSF
jgi:hypothetical protein